MCPSVKSTVVTKESGAQGKVKWSPTQISLGSSLMGSINRKIKQTHICCSSPNSTMEQLVTDRNRKKCVARTHETFMMRSEHVCF